MFHPYKQNCCIVGARKWLARRGCRLHQVLVMMFAYLYFSKLPLVFDCHAACQPLFAEQSFIYCMAVCRAPPSFSVEKVLESLEKLQQELGAVRSTNKDRMIETERCCSTNMSLVQLPAFHHHLPELLKSCNKA